MKITVFVFSILLVFFACGTGDNPQPAKQGGDGIPASANVADVSGIGSGAETTPTPSPANQPRTVRDYFTLLPDEYFTLEGCYRETDKDCNKARAEYLKTFTEVEDIANGYFKGGCDGGQSCIEMAIFKRADGTYLVGLATSGEMMNDFYFLDYSGGKWEDVSAGVVPEFSKNNWYKLPRFGTTVKVYAKKVIEQGDDYQISEKGGPLYTLTWKDGKFVKRK